METKTVTLSNPLRWILGISIGLAVVLLPVLRVRWDYVDTKRLRVVAPGKFYRSGLMTASGFERTLKELKIKTVINLMEEDPDPKLTQTYFGGGKVLERDICTRLGAKFVYLQADTIERQQVNRMRPKAIAEFLAIMNDPANHPVLLHCRAGLHRTGVLSAVYRMEYDKWSPARAWMELRDNGFGEFNCYPDNDYIMQYIHQPAAKNKAQQ